MVTENIICPICKRAIPPLFQEEHHLIPRSMAKRNKYSKLKNKKDTVTLCCNCGDQIHQLFSDKELAAQYNTVEGLLAAPQIQEWIRWVSKKWNDFSISMSSKKKR